MKPASFFANELPIRLLVPTVSLFSAAECRLYDLRRTFATLNIENATIVAAWASLRGHQDLKAITRKTHPSER